MLTSFRISEKTKKLLDAEPSNEKPLQISHAENGSKYLWKEKGNKFVVIYNKKDGSTKIYGPMNVSEVRVLHPELYYVI